MPRATRALFFACIWLGSIALFPRGLVPLAIKLTGGDTKVWFLALYLPDAWQWPTIGLMILTGSVLYRVAFRIYRDAAAR
jgi:ABC-2 type transport system permease protein